MALILSGHHFVARPHVLVLPVMLAWANGLLSASERGMAPSFWLLPLIALWANLHGGFVFGLVLVGGFAIDALWNSDRATQDTGVALGGFRHRSLGGLLRHAVRVGINTRLA